MNKQILVVYKSVTGFTKQYAEWIAEKLNCSAVELKNTTEEMDKVPHFYMQGGLRYENMPFGDKLMMKVFAAMVKRKKEKSEYEKEMLKALNTSYDHTSKEYIEPLADFVLGEERR